jgi:coproporphyrinogen III oxidase-like Fe-S oxidoreductase
MATIQSASVSIPVRILAGVMRIASARAMRLQSVPLGWHPPSPHPDRRYLLYVHVPFCPVLCPFCSFHRVEFQADKTARYFPALRTQIAGYADAGFQLSGVYVGGGTPTVAPDELVATLALVRERFGVVPVSVETNPNDLTPEIVARLQRAGVSRLSVGVQSFDDELLRAMGRYEKYGSSAAIIERLRAARGAFGTLNVDMLFNLPGQSRESVARDLSILTHTLQVDQASIYPLMVTGTTRRSIRARMGTASFAHEAELYRLIASSMRSAAYQLSSAWCFSRTPGLIDEYIVTDDQYVGAGSGAFGYVAGTFFANTFSIHRYSALINGGRSPITMARTMTRTEQARYDLLVRLFGGSVSMQYFEQKYGASIRRLLGLELAGLELLGAIRLEADRIVLTDRGHYYWVVLMREFLTGVNRFREQLRLNLRTEWDRDAEAPLPATIEPR